MPSKLATKIIRHKLNKPEQRDRINARRRARYRKNPARFIESATRWQKKYPEKVKAWRKSKLDRINALRRARYRKNPAPFRESVNRWKRKNPEKVKAYRKRNRERRKAYLRAYNLARYWRDVEASRAKHRAKARKWMRTWTPEKREQIAAQKAQWYRANLERERAKARGRYWRWKLKG